MSNSGVIKSFRPRGLTRSSDKKVNKQATSLMTRPSYLRKSRKTLIASRKTLIAIFGSKYAVKNSYFWVPVHARNQQVFGAGEVSWNMVILGILR